ncbi:MAG: histidine phosphatase family protein [Thermoleophilaceae bacterium]
MGSMAAPEIVLARHGETEWSVSGQHTGTTDIPLTDAGRRQAELLGKRLRGREFAAVLSSPLERALESCRLAGLGDRCETRAELVEWDYGDYEGTTTPKIRETEPGWTVWTHSAPGGETAAEVAARVDRVLDELGALDGDSLVFAHGHLLRMMGARWIGLAPEDGARLALDTATLSVLSSERERRVLSLWNDGSHLDP